MLENLYVHNTKSIDTTQVKRKCGRPPKSKLENSNSNLKCTTAANTCTARSHKTIKIPSNDIASRKLVSKIITEHKKSDRLTVAKLNTISKPYKQDYKSKLMMEKYSLRPINPQQLTPAQTALQRMSEKHPDFEIQAVNTIQPPDIEYTKKSQPLVPVDTPLSVIRIHILRQSDIDKIVESIETRMIQIGITDPCTRSIKSLPNINVISRYLSLHNRSRGKPSGVRVYYPPLRFPQSTFDDSGRNQYGPTPTLQAMWLQSAPTQGCQELSCTENDACVAVATCGDSQCCS